MRNVRKKVFSVMSSKLESERPRSGEKQKATNSNNAKRLKSIDLFCSNFVM
jgi:hypothetical protein